MTAYNTDAWEEFCLIGITQKGGAEVQFAALTEEITGMEWGEKDIEGIPLVSGGRVVKRSPMTDESMTFKVYPVSADMDGTGGIQWFHPQGYTSGSADVTDPFAVPNTCYRNKHRIVLLWTETLPFTPTTASGIPPTTKEAYRIQIFNAYMTAYKPSFDDKTMSAEMTFKWTPFQKDGTRNKIEESTSGTAAAVLPAVTSF